jgi:signal transduction histidine kinase
VRLTEQDLATAVDILLQNVFVHTPEGTAFGISVLARPDGSVVVEVADEGPGFAGSVADGPGSTGLGLSIAARVAQASGGALQTSAAGIRGASAVLVLGPAAP